MSNLRNKPIDQRYLSDQDKADYRRGGGASSQARALKRAKAYQGNMAYNAKRQERTTTQTPGTGGFTGGIAQQQERYREIGRDNQRAKSNRPDMDNSIYDIYKGTS